MLVSTLESDFYLTRASSIIYRNVSRTRLHFLWYDCTVAIIAFFKPISQQDRANASAVLFQSRRRFSPLFLHVKVNHAVSIQIAHVLNHWNISWNRHLGSLSFTYVLGVGPPFNF